MEGRNFDDPISAVGVGVGSRNVPVFCFPASLVFSSADREQVKNILTVYNPYDFPIRFKVLSTTPSHYSVFNPEGRIQSKNCIDLVVTLTSEVPTDSPVPLESKFRIQVYSFSSPHPIGRKDVPSTIIFGQMSPSVSEAFETENYHGIPLESPASSVVSRSGRRFRGEAQRQVPAAVEYAAQPGSTINYVAIITGMVCMIGLLLPLDKDESLTIIPSYLHLSVNQKLIIAYALGIVTMALFRP